MTQDRDPLGRKYPDVIEDDTGANDPDTWGQILFSDDEGLPIGRGWERYVYSKDRKACELRIFCKNEPAGCTEFYAGFVDMNHLCDAKDLQSCIDFLVDWSALNNRSF
jgi:hypothetical protein